MAKQMTVNIQLTKIPSYWPGEVISGQVLIETRFTPHSLSNMILKLLGEAQVLLYRQSGNARHTLQQREQYVNTDMTFAQLTVVPHPETMTRGVHVFEFQVHLPSGVPPSMGGLCGRIYYQLQVLNPAPSARANLVYVLPITVLPYLDVSREPVLQMPVVGESEAVTSGCCSPTNHDVKVKAWLDRGGCFRGEKIPLHVDIYNNSDLTIKYSQLKLIEYHNYHSHDQTSRVIQKVREYAGIKNGRVAPRTQMAWDSEDSRLVLPAYIPITGPPGCSIINISYELEVLVAFKGLCTSKVVLTLPLVIGSPMPDIIRREVERTEELITANMAAALLSMLGSTNRI